MKTINIVLLRHGLTPANQHNRLAGWTDVALAAEGIEELKELRTQVDYPETDVYFSSDLQRAYDTARIIYPDPKVVKLAQFREINFGIYENMGPDELDFRSFFMQWFSPERVEGGENFYEFRERIVTSFHELNHSMIELGHASYTLVSHAGIIRLLYLYCQDLNYRSFFDVPTPNGLGYELEAQYDDGQFKLIRIQPIKRRVLSR